MNITIGSLRATGPLLATLTSLAAMVVALSACPLDGVPPADALQSVDGELAAPECGDGICDLDELELGTCEADCAKTSLCTVTSGTPTLGTCADNGCKKSGGTCKAVDKNGDGLYDACKCAKEVSECGDGVCDPTELESGTCEPDCAKKSLCTVTSSTPTLGYCADNGCKKSGGVCKAVDSSGDGLYDECECAKGKSECGDGVCDPIEVETGSCEEDCAMKSLCTVTSGTPTLGTCADNGCKKKGGKCKALDKSGNGFFDTCECDMTKSLCGDGFCDDDELELGTCEEDCAMISLCTVTAGTPVAGLCADNGCAKKGKECEAFDTNDDGFFDKCKCVTPTPTCGDGVCDLAELKLDPCPEDCAKKSLCTATAGTPTLGTCADNGCANNGGVCKAVDTDKDEIWDDCACIGGSGGVVYLAE